MTIEILDPTYEERNQQLVAPERLGELAGATVGIISNGKQGTGRFFDALADALHSNYGVAAVQRAVKSNYSAPASPDIMEQAKHWHAVISGIGD